jgi:hypothetical protein
VSDRLSAAPEQSGRERSKTIRRLSLPKTYLDAHVTARYG